MVVSSLLLVPVSLLIFSLAAVSGMLVFGDSTRSFSWLGWNDYCGFIIMVGLPCITMGLQMPVYHSALLVGLLGFACRWCVVVQAGFIAVSHLGFVLLASWIFSAYEVGETMLSLVLLVLDLSSLMAVLFSRTVIGGIGPWFYLFFQASFSLAIWWSVLSHADMNSGLVCLGWFTKLGGFMGGFYLMSFYSSVRGQLLYLGAANHLMLGNGLVLVVAACGGSTSLCCVVMTCCVVVLLYWVSTGALLSDIWLLAVSSSSLILGSGVLVFGLHAGSLLGSSWIVAFMWSSCLLWVGLCLSGTTAADWDAVTLEAASRW
jgi:hypothetical protein